jgi:UDP-N-acetylmuramoyl-L-alanyl-D-glutamate--2,6-diaminopimelate ligase
MLQPLRRAAGWSIFVDGAKTPSELREVLATLRELGPQRLITVLGCAGGSRPALCEAMGEAAADGADLSLITSDNPRHQSPHTLAMQVLRGYATRRNDGARLELNREAAILAAVRMAQPSDIILIAGKGHATSQEIGGAIMPFNDLEQARESVYRVKTSSTSPETLPRFISTPTRSFYPVGQN